MRAEILAITNWWADVPRTGTRGPVPPHSRCVYIKHDERWATVQDVQINGRSYLVRHVYGSVVHDGEKRTAIIVGTPDAKEWPDGISVGDEIVRGIVAGDVGDALNDDVSEVDVD